MVEVHKDRLAASIESLWTSHMYSDLIVRCREEEYKVHRSILCPRSTFFAKACNGDFMEGKTGIIKMDEDDPQAVKRLLLYLYMLDYPEDDKSDVPLTMDHSHPPRLSSAATEVESLSGTMTDSYDYPTSSDPRMMNNVLVYAVAEKYDIPDLKDLAKSKFLTLATSKWPHVDLYAVLETIFSTTPDGDMGLRQIVLDICRQHAQDILRDNEARAAFLDIQAINTIVLDTAVQKNDEDKILLDLAVAKQIALEDQFSKAEAKTQQVLNEKLEITVMLEFELVKARAETQTAMNQKNDLFLKFNGLVDNINCWEDCRNCGSEFGVWIDRWKAKTTLNSSSDVRDVGADMIWAACLRLYLQLEQGETGISFAGFGGVLGSRYLCGLPLTR